MTPTTTSNDEINRIVWGLGAFASFAGIIAIAGSPVIMPRVLPAIGTKVFEFDPAFLTQGALVVVALWALSAVHFALVFLDGQWRPFTRRLDLVLSGAWSASLLWLAIGPRIFTNPETDITGKAALACVFFFVLIDLIQKTRTAIRGS